MKRVLSTGVLVFGFLFVSPVGHADESAATNRICTCLETTGNKPDPNGNCGVVQASKNESSTDGNGKHRQP